MKVRVKKKMRAISELSNILIKALSLQDTYGNRIAAANVSCTLQYYQQDDEQPVRLSDACAPAEGDDSALMAATFATVAGLYQVVARLGQPGMPDVLLPGDLTLLWLRISCHALVDSLGLEGEIQSNLKHFQTSCEGGP